MFKRKLKYIVFILFVIVVVKFSKMKISANSVDDNFSTIVMSVKHPLELGELNVEGYTIYTNNINYGVVGVYTITYQEKADKNVFVKRDVYIINDEATDYSSFGIEKEKEIEIENFVSMDKKIINDNDYYLILKYKHLDKNDIRVILFIDGEIYFQNNFYPYEYIDSFVTMDEYNRPVINMIILDENDNMKLLSVNYEEVETLVNFNLERCLFLKYNQYNNGLYLIYEDRIVEIKLQNNKIVRTINVKGSALGYKFVNAFIVDMDNDFYYGYLFLDEDNNDYYYQLLNKDLEIYRTIKIGSEVGLYNNAYINKNGKIYLFSYECNNKITIDSEIGIFKYKIYGIDDKKVIEGKIEFNSCISEIMVSEFGEMIYLNIGTENNYYYKYKVFEDIIMPLNNSNIVYKDDFYYEYIESEETVKYGINNKLDLIYKRKTVDNNGVEINLDYPIMFVNGYLCELDFNLGYEKYGRYTSIANLNLDGFRVNLGYSYYVFDMCNLLEAEVYQIGTIVSFVGEGKLNGVSIESGYKIEAIGNYVLIIKGVNEEKYISFEVKDLNEESNSIDSIGKNSENNKIFRVEQVNVNDVSERNSSYVTNDSRKEINPYLYILMVAIITILCIIGLKIIIKRKVSSDAK